MTLRRVRRLIGSVAGFTALAYFTLVVLAAGCLFMHAAPAGGHDHHSSDSSHSPLCAWICQAVSDDTLISTPPIVAAWSVEGVVDPCVSASLASAFIDLLTARAPPQSFLS